MKTLTSWLKYLETLHPKTMDLGLERVSEVAEKIKLLPFAKFNPLTRTPFIITVTGTNGKGSTVRLLENILLNAGYKVGAYTSPHLINFNERIRIDGIDANDEKICQALQEIEAKRDQTTLTYFEFTTLAALLLFNEAQLDFIILEVGLGGRLDATNIIDADLAVITNVALDHCDWLGDTREKIAYEKAGVIKKNKLICFGEKDVPEAILKRCEELSAELFFPGQDYDYKIAENMFVWESKDVTQYLPIPFVHPSNAAVAIMAIETISPIFNIPLTAIKKAMAETILPGRLQLISKPHLTLLDVAHNPHGIANLAEHLQKNYSDKKILAVFSVLADKDLIAILKIMQPLIQHWFIAQLMVARAASLQDMEQTFKQCGINNFSKATTIVESYEQALEQAKETPVDFLIVVFGSFHTVAEIKISEPRAL